MFIDLLSSRRSIRRFDDKPVPKEKIDHLVEAALRSFSSRGFNPWRFIVIEDKETLDTLSKAKAHGSTFLKNATLGIAVCGEPEKSDVWVEDTSIASAIIHLAAHDMGLGSCWIQIRKREHSAFKSAETYVKEVLQVPDKLSVESIIAIGFPAEAKQGHPATSLEYEKVSYNYYNQRE